MLIPVPYYSQHLDVLDTGWKDRACAIACIKMILSAKGIETPPLDEMIQKGLALDAHGPSGWIHNGLIKLAAEYGSTLSRAEWRASETKTNEELNEEGIRFLVSEIRAGRPVIVSAIKKFTEKDKFHMVVLVGFQEQNGVINGFLYHDPDSTMYTEGENQYVPMDIFQETWRRMAIFG